MHSKVRPRLAARQARELPDLDRFGQFLRCRDYARTGQPSGSLLRVPPRCPHDLRAVVAPYRLGLGRADDQEGAHVDLERVQVGQVDGADGFLGAADVAGEDDRGVGGAVFQEEFAGLADLPGAAAGAGVVEGEGQVGGGRRVEAFGDDFPGLEAVGEEMTA